MIKIIQQRHLMYGGAIAVIVLGAGLSGLQYTALARISHIK
jgi:hypothetical protein